MAKDAEEHLHRARFGLWEQARSLSARSVLTWPQGLAFAALIAGLGAGAAASPETAWRVAHAVFWALFAAATVLRLFAAAATLKDQAPPPGPVWQASLPRYTILCPLYREAGSVASLAAALDRLDYPREQLEILFIIEEDDLETRRAMEALPAAPHRRAILVPPAAPRTKPKALNFALARSDGAFVAVYDAEDAPHPMQLRAALDAFAAGGTRLGAVQSPLRVDNGEASWIASQFAAEYAIQFRGILPLLAHVRAPLPLGGAGNHFRRDALMDAGAWDPFNVTEDADLGYRLARRGWKIGVIAPPVFEEGPATLPAWIRQRTRWIKGHIQTWLVLMRSPWRTAREMGLSGFLWMQLVLGGGLVAAFAHAPLLVLVVMALVAPDVAPFGPADWTLLITGYVTATLAALFAAAIERDRRLALSAITMPLYWPLASIAGVLAVFELLVRPHYWAKTEHGLTPRRTLPEKDV